MSTATPFAVSADHRREAALLEATTLTTISHLGEALEEPPDVAAPTASSRSCANIFVWCGKYWTARFSRA